MKNEPTSFGLRTRPRLRCTASVDRITPTSAAPPPSTGPTPPTGDAITAVARLVGDRWSVLVVRNVFRGLRRFQELHDDLGVSKAVLAERLRRLIDAGVLTKVPYQERPVRYEYRLTEMGRELSPVLVALLHWGDRWLAGDAPTAVLVHAPCGNEFRQAFWCPTCKTTFGPTAIRAAADADQS